MVSYYRDYDITPDGLAELNDWPVFGAARIARRVRHGHMATIQAYFGRCGLYTQQG